MSRQGDFHQVRCGDTCMNICGVLVHAHPKQAASVASALSFLDGVEVHQTGESGQIILTVEDTDGRPAIDTLIDIQRHRGVLAASLVYHHFEAAADGAAATSIGESP
ncbi:MAG: chaperone NapD [Hyphomicrobiaceae bacterium]|nr:MAG: chaperone NapD [Hyphomicrobiaceae bacterium]